MRLCADKEAASTEKILAAAKHAGIEIDLAIGGAVTPTGLPVPELQIGEVKVQHTNPILRRVAQTCDCGLMGSSFMDESQVDSWMDWGTLLLDHHVLSEKAPLEPICDVLEPHLKSRTFLVGQRLTVADISLSISCKPLLEAADLEAVRQRYPATVRWLQTCVHQLGLGKATAPVPETAQADRKTVAPPSVPSAKAPMKTTPSTSAPAAEEAAAAPQAEKEQALAEAQQAGKTSKGEEKKKAKEDAKKAKEEEKKRREAEQKAAHEAKFKGPDVTLETMDSEQFGNLFIRSECKTNREWTTVRKLVPALKGTKVWIRARVANSRKQGAKLCFMTLRQHLSTVQAVCFGPEIAGFAGALPDESVVDVFGEVTCPDAKVMSCSQQDVEIQVDKLFCVGRSQVLPLQLADAGRSEEEAYVKVNQDTRLDNRIIDLRTAANQAIFRMQSGVCALFREFLASHDFTEIHTPKLIGSASEGGADVFRVDYFDGNAYLAQSPQLYKQMVLMADMNRVFEIGPIFRSEKSFTHRHMTEFVGLDMEMTFNDHYSEVLDVLDGMFNHIFNGLNERFKDEIEAVRKQYPFEDLKWKYPCLRLTFKEAIEILKVEGPKIIDERLQDANTDYERKLLENHKKNMQEHDILDDISTEDEKVLGEVILRKYGEELYIIDKFPADVRPFYSMRDPRDPRWANAYDVFLRGEEITSGAQRIHDPNMLQAEAEAKGIVLHQPYLDSFRYGAYPHAGAGIGLERVVMLFLRLHNIRKTSLFPRDPKRLNP